MNEFNKYLLNASNVPVVVLGDDGLATKKTEENPCPSYLGFNTEEREWITINMYQVYIIDNIPFLESCVGKNIWTIKGFNYIRKINLLSNAVDQWLVSIC